MLRDLYLKYLTNAKLLIKVNNNLNGTGGALS